VQKTLPAVEPAQKRPPAEPPKRQPPSSQRGQPTPPSPPDEAPADPAALIERLRRQRQQREKGQAATGTNNSRQVERPRSADNAAVEQRFAAGDRIFCLPYGDGEVRASRVEGGRELLTVSFPSYGELTIDPGVSLVRKHEDTPREQDDLL